MPEQSVMNVLARQVGGAPIQRQLADGRVIEFDPGTPDDVQMRVISRLDAKPSTLGAVKRSVERGAGMGLLDEVGALGTAVGRETASWLTGDDVNFGEAYNQALAQERGQMDADRAQAPIMSVAGEALGGFAAAPAKALGTLTAGTTAAPSMAGNVANAAKAGAVGGGVTGFTEGEGGVLDRGENAAFGAALGMTAGVGLSTMMDGLPRLRRLVLGPRESEVGRHSAAALMSAFEKDGFTRAQALTAMERWQRSGADPEMIADLGGPAVRRLARAARSASPKAGSMADSALLGRHLDQGDRLTDATRKATGQKGSQYYEAIEEMAKERSAKARPLYDAAANEPVWGDWFASATKNPRIQKALKIGREALEDESLALGIDPPDIKVFTDFDAAGVGQLNSVPTVREWDAVKRGLDRIIQDGRDPLTGRLNGEAQGADMLRRKLLKELDRIPAYAEARAAWAGPSEAIELADKGRSVFKKDPEIIAREIAGIRNPENLDFYKMGVARAMEDKLDAVRGTADATLRFTPKVWKQVNAALGPDATNALKSAVDREIRMAQTLNVVSRGSQTQDKMSDALMLARPEDMGGVSEFLRGDIRGGLLRKAAEMANRRTEGITEKVGERLGTLMFTPPSAGPNATQAVRDAARAQLEEAIRRSLLEQQTGAAAGRAAGLLTGP